MKKKAEEIKKEPKEEVKNLLLHLESEYRKANISEKNYKELKEKYNKMLKGDSKTEKKIEEKPPEEEIDEEEETEEAEPEEVEEHLKKVEEVVEKEINEEKVEKKGFFKSFFGKKKEPETAGQPTQNVEQPSIDNSKNDPPPKDKKSKEKEEEITEITPEVIERLAQQAKEQAEGQTEETKEEKKSGGLLKSIFGKKEEAKPLLEASAESAPESLSAEKTKSNGIDYGVDIEKLKVMIDTVRESGKVTDETARGLSESIGELRSMIFQADAELKEVSLKMEKIEDEITDVKPQEMQKRFREYNEKFEKNQLELEKLNKKAEDSGEKINKVFELLKGIGGIENLININQQVQKKLEDINEAMKYIERIGNKTEKMFIDINRGLQDLVILRAKQDDFSENLKDMIKNIDSLNVKFEGYVTKKDIDSFKEDSALIKKQIEDIKKVLPIAELKLPENIINLRKEREDIKLLLESLEEQHSKGKVSNDEFVRIKDANMKRLEEIRTILENEWKKVADLIKISEKEETEEVEPIKVEEKIEGKPKKKVEKVPEEEEVQEKPKEIIEEKPKKPEIPKEKIIEKPKPKKELKKKIIKKESPKKIAKKKEKLKPQPKKIVKSKSESQRKAEILSSLKRLH